MSYVTTHAFQYLVVALRRENLTRGAPMKKGSPFTGKNEMLIFDLFFRVADLVGNFDAEARALKNQKHGSRHGSFES